MPPCSDMFLDRITGGDVELATYIRKAIGYTLTGVTDEQVLFFVYGNLEETGSPPWSTWSGTCSATTGVTRRPKRF